MFKFLHAADVHLDSPLRGLGRSDDLPADEIRGASRRALDNLVRLAVAEGVAFVLIAGDVYDGDWKDYNTGLWFARKMAELRDSGIKVFLIRGNHDAKNKMTESLPLPDNVHQFDTDRAGTERLDAWNVAVHGQGFASGAVPDDLSARYPGADRGLLNLWMLHTSAGGSADHDTYAPCTVEALRSKGYGYWALGHIHKRAILSSDDAWVAFPGNVQGRHIKEPGAKGCLLVTVDDRGEIASVDFRALDVLRWETCRVDAAGLASVDDLYPRFEAAATALLAASDGRPVVARVEVVGACPAHDAIEAKGPRIVADLRATALRVGGNFWVEKVKLATTAESSSLGLDEPGDDALAVLREVIDGLRADPESLRALARAEFDDLRARLAAERDGFEQLNLDSTDWLLDALERARPILLDRLRGASAG